MTMENHEMQALIDPKEDRLANPHPADILIHDFGLTDVDIDEVATAAGIDPAKLRGVILDRESVTVEIDTALTKHFGVSDGFFLRLQASYDEEEWRLSEYVTVPGHERMTAAEIVQKLADAAAERDHLTAANAFLTAHTQRLIDRLAGARMMAGDLSIEAATQFVNAERGVVKSVLERVG